MKQVFPRLLKPTDVRWTFSIGDWELKEEEELELLFKIFTELLLLKDWFINESGNFLGGLSSNLEFCLSIVSFSRLEIFLGLGVESYNMVFGDSFVESKLIFELNPILEFWILEKLFNEEVLETSLPTK